MVRWSICHTVSDSVFQQFIINNILLRWLQKGQTLKDVALVLSLISDENGRVTYHISAGNSRQYFKIDGDSGLVTIKKPVDSDNLQSSRIALNISAADHGMFNI